VGDRAKNAARNWCHHLADVAETSLLILCFVLLDICETAEQFSSKISYEVGRKL